MNIVTPLPVIVSGSTPLRLLQRYQLPLWRTSACNVVTDRAGTPWLFVKHRTLALAPTIARSCCALAESACTPPPVRSHHIPPSPMTCTTSRYVLVPRSTGPTGLITIAATASLQSSTIPGTTEQWGFTHGIHPTSVVLGRVVLFLLLETPHTSHGASCVCLSMAPSLPLRFLGVCPQRVQYPMIFPPWLHHSRHALPSTGPSLRAPCGKYLLLTFCISNLHFQTLFKGCYALMTGLGRRAMSKKGPDAQFIN